MKIMTFNIQHALNYKTRKIDYALFIRSIKKFNPDLCGLNEVRGRGWMPSYKNQTGIIAKGLGWYGYFGKAVMLDFGNPYGNAVVSQHPFKSVETVKIPDPVKDEDGYYETRCVIRAVQEYDGKDVMFLICHMGLNLGERKNAVEVICRLLDETDMPAVVMGDFNIEPHGQELKPLFERLTDTDKTGECTFPSDNPVKKIDYIFYRGLECMSVMTVDEVISDHLPIIAEFKVI